PSDRSLLSEFDALKANYNNAARRRLTTVRIIKVPRTRSPHNPFNDLGGIMNQRQLSIMKRTMMLALFVLVLAPVSTFAQRRWVVVRPHRSRVVIYQPRPYVVYQRPRYTYRTDTYGYPQSYDSAYYSNGYGYTEPYY